MTYADILLWAKKGIEAEIYKQKQMFSDARKYETPTAPALRELLSRNVNELNDKLKYVESLLEDPTGLGR